MGVKATHYVTYGLKLPFKFFSEEQREELYDLYDDNAYKEKITHEDISVISDGMGGEYLFIGKILAKGSESNGLEFTEISLSEAEERKTKDLVLSIIKKYNLENKANKESRITFKYYAFTHFS
jgi:hypothetical protein